MGGNNVTPVTWNARGGEICDFFPLAIARPFLRPSRNAVEFIIIIGITQTVGFSSDRSRAHRLLNDARRFAFDREWDVGGLDFRRLGFIHEISGLRKILSMAFHSNFSIRGRKGFCHSSRFNCVLFVC